MRENNIEGLENNQFILKIKLTDFLFSKSIKFYLEFELNIENIKRKTENLEYDSNDKTLNTEIYFKLNSENIKNFKTILIDIFIIIELNNNQESKNNLNKFGSFLLSVENKINEILLYKNSSHFESISLKSKTSSVGKFTLEISIIENSIDPELFLNLSKNIDINTDNTNKNYKDERLLKNNNSLTKRNNDYTKQSLNDFKSDIPKNIVNKNNQISKNELLNSYKSFKENIKRPSKNNLLNTIKSITLGNFNNQNEDIFSYDKWKIFKIFDDIYKDQTIGTLRIKIFKLFDLNQFEKELKENRLSIEISVIDPDTNQKSMETYFTDFYNYQINEILINEEVTIPIYKELKNNSYIVLVIFLKNKEDYLADLLIPLNIFISDIPKYLILPIQSMDKRKLKIMIGFEYVSFPYSQNWLVINNISVDPLLDIFSFKENFAILVSEKEIKELNFSFIEIDTSSVDTIDDLNELIFKNTDQELHHKNIKCLSLFTNDIFENKIKEIELMKNELNENSEIYFYLLIDNSNQIKFTKNIKYNISFQLGALKGRILNKNLNKNNLNYSFPSIENETQITLNVSELQKYKISKDLHKLLTTNKFSININSIINPSDAIEQFKRVMFNNLKAQQSLKKLEIKIEQTPILSKKMSSIESIIELENQNNKNSIKNKNTVYKENSAIKKVIINSKPSNINSENYKMNQKHENFIKSEPSGNTNDLLQIEIKQKQILINEFLKEYNDILDTYKMSKEEIDILNSQIKLLKSESIILEKKVNIEDCFEEQNYLQNDIKGLSELELKEKFIKSAQLYKFERDKSIQLERNLKQTEIDLSKIKRLKEEYEKINNDYNLKNNELLSIQKEINNINIYKETISKQEAVIIKLQKEIEKHVNQKHKENELEQTKIQNSKNILQLKEEIENNFFRTGGIVNNQKELEELTRLESIKENLKKQLMNNNIIPKNQIQIIENKKNLETDIEKLKLEADRLEKILIQESKNNALKL